MKAFFRGAAIALIITTVGPALHLSFGSQVLIYLGWAVLDITNGICNEEN